MIRKPNIVAESGIPRRRRGPPRTDVKPVQILMITGVIMLLTLLGGTSWLVLDRRCSDLSAAEENTFSLALALAGQTSRTFEQVDLVLSDLVGRIHDDEVTTPEALNASMATPAIQRMLRDDVTKAKRIDNVVVFDAIGQPIVALREGPPAIVGIDDRDYFLALRDDPGLDNFISKPELDRSTGAMAVFLAHRISAPGGQFLGVAVAAIKQSYFANHYYDVAQANGDVVALVRRDGELIVRQPTSDRLVVRTPAEGPPASTLQAERQSAALLLPTPLMDAASVRSSYAVPGFPLFILVSRTQSSILALWRQQTCWIGIGAALLTLSLLTAITTLRRQITQREKSAAKYAAALANLSQGIILVDGDLCLSVCNDRAAEILKIPAGLRAVNPLFDDIVHLQWERGEIGSMEEKADAAEIPVKLTEPSVYEARQPDGTVIEVVTVPLPQGGMVRTYTDVTVARNREAALQAALVERDKVETALVAQRDDLERELIKRTRGLVASEALHRDVAEVASDWIWETNATNQLTFLSKRFGVTSGIAWSDATDRLFSDLVGFGFDAVGMAEIITAMQARSSFHDAVFSVFPKSGQQRFWRLSGRPFLEPGTAQFAGYRGTGTDVTALIEQETVLTAARVRAEAAEQEAQQARSRLVEAIEAVPEGFVLHDADDRLVLSNARYREIQALPPEFTQPGVTFKATLHAIYRLHFGPEGRTEDEWVAERLVQHRRAGIAPTEQRLVNGRWLQVEERHTSDGGTVGISIDVTDARALEAAEHERSRASAEMQAARMLQASLLPSAHLQHAIIGRSGLDIASRTASCSELGGDLWGMSDLDEGRVGVYTVDFTGHGTAAALNTVRLHTLIHELRSTMLEPDQFLKALNERLTELLPLGTFATMFYGIIDSCQDCFTYAVAGSPPPVIRSRPDLPLTMLDSTGMPLGIVAGANYVSTRIRFEAGGQLVLYSDMLTDFIDGQGNRGGDAGAFNLISQCISAPTAQAMVDRICAPFLDDLTTPLTDDLTVICIRRP